MSNATLIQTQTPSQTYDLSLIGRELSSIAKALARLSKKMQTVSSIKPIAINKKTDPDMFTQEFINTVRQSKNEIVNGEIIPFDPA